MPILHVLECANTVFDMGLSQEELNRWADNNEYFLESGLIAIELARRSADEDLTWTAFKDKWWMTLGRAISDVPSRLDISRLGYLVYASKRYDYSSLPDSVQALNTSPGNCAFPLCQDATCLHRDHIWPRSMGGPDYEWNIQNLCGFHNRMKSYFPGLNFCDPSPLRQALEIAYPP